MTRKLVCIAMAAGTVVAQDVGAPDLALIFDRAHRTIHRIVGSPGAAVMRPVTVAGEGIAAAVPANARSPYALVVTEPNGQVGIAIPSADPSSPRMIAHVSPRPALISVSPRGLAAALLYPERGVIQVVAGLPNAPELSGELPLPGGTVEMLAVSNTGAVLIGVAREDGSSAVFAAAPGRAWTAVTSARKLGGIAFANGTNAAAVSDTARSEVHVVNDVFQPAAAAVLTDAHGISAPAHLAFSTDDSLLVATTAGSGVVTIADLKTPSVASVDCECSPVMVQPAGDAVFLLGSGTDGPMPMIDTRGTRRVLFIPPKREF